MVLFVFLIVWRVSWVVLLPVVLIYLKRRGRKDPRYLTHLGERFGRYGPLPQNAIWIHAVSLGETRSTVPLVRDCLARGEKVIFTHFTPAGRAEAETVFAPEIAAGDVASVWVPFDMFWTYGRFFRTVRPKLGLTMETEIWPAMIFAARRHRVPLYLCNAKYPSRSFAKDQRGLRVRQRVMTGLAGAFVKSKLHANRYGQAGVRRIEVTGELRFDQPIPRALLDAADRTRPILGARPVITFASAVEGEDALFLETIQTLLTQTPRPLIIYVPRAPERFDSVADMFDAAGIRLARRSALWGAGVGGLDQTVTWPDPAPDVVLGDTMGEMYFYLSLADRVVVGGGFIPAGAHNISEALAVGKPVVTGPQTHMIEYPFVEAEAAGVAVSVADGAALTACLSGPVWADADTISTFMDQHRGAAKRTANAILSPPAPKI